jgi:2-C-methyl-D-erythritol 2,4-cyclodiphosphate synthase
LRVERLIDVPVRARGGAGADEDRSGRERIHFLRDLQENGMRIGFGYDSHRLAAGRRLVLGGMEIPNEKGLLGHSDADVLIHTVCDAILGAVGEGDIGRQFPDTDPAYRDISSLILLERVRALAAARGYQVCNVDSTIVLENPKLAPHLSAMAENIAGILRIPSGRVSVKAKTNEGMGLVGAGEGAAAFTVVLVEGENAPQVFGSSI